MSETPPNGSRSRLVIVESPAKAKTISGYLGRDYVVESSIGHIRDLPGTAADMPAEQKNEAGLAIADRDERRSSGRRVMGDEVGGAAAQPQAVETGQHGRSGGQDEDG